MDQLVKTMDLDKNIGVVTLSDGVTKLGVPKLSMSKIIRIVKFLGVDGSKIYGECREILLDKKLDDIEKVGVIFENLKEEQLIHIFSILLDLPDDEVLALDPNEMLEVLLVYADKMDFQKTFTLVRQLMKKMFNKELPDNISEWFPKRKVPNVSGSNSLSS